MGRYKEKRKYNDWGTPITGLFRALVDAIGRKGITKDTAMEQELKFLVPTYENYFPHPVTAHQVYDRWNKGAVHNPGELKKPNVARYMEIAHQIVRERIQLTDGDVAHIVQTGNRPMAIVTTPRIPRPTKPQLRGLSDLELLEQYLNDESWRSLREVEIRRRMGLVRAGEIGQWLAHNPDMQRLVREAAMKAGVEVVVAQAKKLAKQAPPLQQNGPPRPLTFNNLCKEHKDVMRDWRAQCRKKYKALGLPPFNWSNRDADMENELTVGYKRFEEIAEGWKTNWIKPYVKALFAWLLGISEYEPKLLREKVE